eukprot:9473110-Pyramimonas_sp.AAC.2
MQVQVSNLGCKHSHVRVSCSLVVLSGLFALSAAFLDSPELRLATCVTGNARDLELTSEFDRARVSKVSNQTASDVFVAIDTTKGAACVTNNSSQRCRVLAAIIQQLRPLTYRCDPVS